jgi:hypothetical protein
VNNGLGALMALLALASVSLESMPTGHLMLVDLLTCCDKQDLD